MVSITPCVAACFDKRHLFKSRELSSRISTKLISASLSKQRNDKCTPVMKKLDSDSRRGISWCAFRANTRTPQLVKGKHRPGPMRRILIRYVTLHSRKRNGSETGLRNISDNGLRMPDLPAKFPNCYQHEQSII